MRTLTRILLASGIAISIGCASGGGSGASPAGAVPAAASPKATTDVKKPGFYTKIVDGRLWVFREGSKELESFLKTGDYPTHVARPGGGPNGMTIRGPDAETIDAYMAAPK